MPDVYLFGLDKGFENPGLGFVLGSQDNSIRNRLANNSLYAPSEFLTSPFQQNRTTTYGFDAVVEPFQDFRINVNGRKNYTDNYQEIFRNDADNPGFVSINPNRTGTYGISFMMIKTAFEKDNEDNTSPLFENFENYRSALKQRLDGLNENGEYDINSQEVVIPAFIAAYTGKNPESVNLSPFPKLPIPNWSINYNGLSKLPGISDVFSTFSISHAYASQYDVSNFVNSPLYTTGLTLDYSLRDAGLASQFNENGDLVPVYLAQQVVMTERMAPFIGMNMRTKGNWTLRLDYNRERNLGLNLSNIQITERQKKDFVLNIGFAKSGVQIPFRINGRRESLPNELRFNMGLTVSDTKVVQRRIDEDPIITDGIMTFRLNPTVDYKISEALLVTLYFDRSVNDPRVSTSFLNARTTFGGRIQFSLSQ
jgi:cell surface protein SprA